MNPGYSFNLSLPSTETGLATPYPYTGDGYAQMLAEKRAAEQREERMWRQRYAESAFDNAAKSPAGAVGAFQIMPITYKDYLERGKGKPGDLTNPVYNRKVRDFVLGIIPRDLGSLWSKESPEDINLAKRYAAYNWGAGSLRSYLRKKQKEGVDIHNSLDWMAGLPKETRDYVNFIVFNQDVPDTSKVADLYKAAKNKYNSMAFGGVLGRFNHSDIRSALDKMRQNGANKYDGKSEPTGQMMLMDEDGNLVDSINPAVYSLRDITGLKRRDIKRLAELDALSGEGMPALDTGTDWRKRVYGRKFEKTVAEAAKQQEKQALFNAAVDELRSGKPTGAFKELTKEGIESAAPLAMGIVGAAAAPVLLEGAASAYAIPKVKTALDVAGSLDGVRNLVSGNGIRKTIGYINDGNYGRAALSGLGDAFDLFGGIGLLKDVGRAVQGTHSYQKAKKLYDMGNGHNVNLFSVEPWRDAARQYATKTKSFTHEEKARIHERVKRAEASRTNERLFGDSYKEVFKKHATTPELKKMFKENPEYLYFVEKTGLDPLAQETIDAFGMQQNRSIRGVYLKKATKENVDRAMTEFNPQRANSGGDRLNSGGGVYSSNSGELADKFQRPTSDVITDNVVSELQYPYVRVKGTPREQLKALREQVLNRDDWFSDSNALLHQLPPQRKYRFLESEYTRRNGDVVSGAFERVTTKPQDVQSITSTYSHGLRDLKGRWGLNGVSTRPEDARLFIPKVTTRADLRKIISEGKQTIYRDVMDDYLLNIQKQQSRKRSLIENSLPYKVGNHVYDNTAIIGNKEVYSPLFITGSVAGGAGLLTGTILGGNQAVKEAQERNERDLRQFKKSELYKKFVESSGGPENFMRYLKEFKANKKKKDKKD